MKNTSFSCIWSRLRSLIKKMAEQDSPSIEMVFLHPSVIRCYAITQKKESKHTRRGGMYLLLCLRESMWCGRDGEENLGMSLLEDRRIMWFELFFFGPSDLIKVASIGESVDERLEGWNDGGVVVVVVDPQICKFGLALKVHSNVHHETSDHEITLRLW